MKNKQRKSSRLLGLLAAASVSVVSLQSLAGGTHSGELKQASIRTIESEATSLSWSANGSCTHNGSC